MSTFVKFFTLEDTDKVARHKKIKTLLLDSDVLRYIHSLSEFEARLRS